MDLLTVIEPTHWTFWLGIAIALAILEVLDGSFFLLSLALGCLFPAVAAAMGLESVSALVGICVAGQLLVFFSVRPLFRRVMAGEHEMMNSDALVGRKAFVTQSIQGSQTPGYVKIGGEEWRAIGVANEALVAHVEVIVLEVSGSTVTVTRCNVEES
jgi:membrane protein implicated in regulation of membrane protease activity